MKKRGLAISCKSTINMSQINIMSNLSWYYNWSTNPGDAISPRIEFVPMIWKKCSNQEFTKINKMYEKGLIKYVLCINEPDLSSQANLTVDELIERWKLITENLHSDIKLVSPALASFTNYKTYFQQFIDGIKKLNLRKPDFIAMHIYGSLKSDHNKIIDDVYDMYKIDIWLTEFAPFHGTSKKDQKTILNETKKIISELQMNPHVFRYALFGCSNKTNEDLYKFALFEADTTIVTDMGKMYQSEF